MPQVGAWEAWRWSTAVRIQLRRGCSYDLAICDDSPAFDDRLADQFTDSVPMPLINMSYLAHFTLYTHGSALGGGERTANFVNIAILRLMLLAGDGS